MFYSRKILLIGSCLLWLALCQFIFQLLYKQDADRIALSISNQFRSEIYSENYQKISNIIADLTRSNYIRCSVLSRLDEHNKREIINFTSIQNCTSSNFLNFENTTKTIVLKSIGGISYILSFQIVNQGYFYIAIWSLRIAGILFLILMNSIFNLQEKKRLIEIKHLNEIADAKELLSYKVAHDIRSPLSVINLINEKLKIEDEEIKNIFSQAIQRINDIAEDLLNKKHSQQTQKTNITICISNIIKEKLIEFKKYNKKCTIEVINKSNIDLHTNIGKSDFNRIISNLLNNSIEAIQEDKVGKIQITLNSEKNMTSIEIKDNGQGIPEKIISKIGTEGFSYGKKHTSSGYGLGIFQAKKIIEALGGKLLIESHPGEGATIRLII